MGATGRSTGGKRDCSAWRTETAETVVSHAATKKQARQIEFAGPLDCTPRLGASRVSSEPRSSTRVLPPPRGQQHRDDRHAVDDLAFQYHPQHRIERERADVDELRFIGSPIAALKAVGQEQMRRLVDDALARVIGAHVHESLCLISGLFRELALSGLLQCLTRVDTASGHLPGRTSRHIAILSYEQDRVRIDKRQEADTVTTRYDAVDSSSAVGQRDQVLAHGDPLVGVDRLRRQSPPGSLALADHRRQLARKRRVWYAVLSSPASIARRRSRSSGVSTSNHDGKSTARKPAAAARRRVIASTSDVLQGTLSKSSRYGERTPIR